MELLRDRRRKRDQLREFKAPDALRRPSTWARPRAVPVSGRIIGTERRVPRPVLLFAASLFIPWVFMIGPLAVSPYRLVLIVTLVPNLIWWISGASGRVFLPDILLLLFCFWTTVSMAVTGQGIEFVQSSGVMFVETMGPYLLARRYVHKIDDVKSIVRLSRTLVLLILPFAIYETLTGDKPILKTFSAITNTFEFFDTSEFRMGLARVQGPFEHPILFGVFCGSILAISHLVSTEERGKTSRWLLSGAIGGTAFLSLSSAPIAGLVVQISLMTWNAMLRQFRGRWKVLWGLAGLAYLVVEFGSNQTPAQFYISHFTFDQTTGWYRLFIWHYGSASVLNHPIFGIGFGDWVRPKWMYSDSVDNFWLLIAMRHGIPAIALLLASYLLITFAVGLSRLKEGVQDYRVAYLICMATYFFVGCTVHFWTTAYVWFLFLLGSGVWMLNADVGDDMPVARITGSRWLRKVRHRDAG
jgi:O-antigen ligase